MNFIVEDMRVGDRTDYNRLRFEIGPTARSARRAALHKAANILKDHFEKVSVVEVQEFEAAEERRRAEEEKDGKEKERRISDHVL